MLSSNPEHPPVTPQKAEESVERKGSVGIYDKGGITNITVLSLSSWSPSQGEDKELCGWALLLHARRSVNMSIPANVGIINIIHTPSALV